MIATQDSSASFYSILLYSPKTLVSSLEDLYNLRAFYSKNIILSYINVNSIINKLDDLKLLLGKSLDIICISETKLDETILTVQFAIECFSKPYRLYVTSNNEGLLFYVKANLPSKLIRFYPLLCGFRSRHSTQHALLNLINKWHSCLDNSGLVGAILMDLSKAFDCLPHERILARLHAYGVEIKNLKILQDYLSNRTQRIKLDSTMSSWLQILLETPQGSIIGPLFFNIF